MKPPAISSSLLGPNCMPFLLTNPGSFDIEGAFLWIFTRTDVVALSIICFELVCCYILIMNVQKNIDNFHTISINFEHLQKKCIINEF